MIDPHIVRGALVAAEMELARLNRLYGRQYAGKIGAPDMQAHRRVTTALAHIAAVTGAPAEATVEEHMLRLGMVPACKDQRIKAYWHSDRDGGPGYVCGHKPNGEWQPLVLEF